jgi:predicted MPP superfamily phosphohydrolase
LSVLPFILGLGVLVLAVWYVPWRVAGLLGSKKRLWPWRALVAVITLGFIAAMRGLIFATGQPLLARLYIVWASLFCLTLYLLLLLLLAQLLALAPTGLRREPRAVLAVVVILAAALTGYQARRVQSYVITETVVPIPGLARPVRLMHFADLHLGALRGRTFLDRILEDVRARRPDIVIWNGDLVSGDLALDDRLLPSLKGLGGIEQYYVTGNHEYDVDTHRLGRLLEDAGVRILRSRMVQTHGLQLIGLEYMNGDPDEIYDEGVEMVTELTVAEVLPAIARDRSKPTVLVHHSPAGLRHAAMGEVDLMLSGNAHAGQKSPLTSMFRISPNTWPAGPRDVGHMVLLVSSGGGDYACWFRLGSPYEFQLVDLVPG